MGIMIKLLVKIWPFIQESVLAKRTFKKFMIDNKMILILFIITLYSFSLIINERDEKKLLEEELKSLRNKFTETVNSNYSQYTRTNITLPIIDDDFKKGPKREEDTHKQPPIPPSDSTVRPKPFVRPKVNDSKKDEVRDLILDRLR